MKIFLTGSSGFVGEHTMDEYLEAGHHVEGLDKDVNNTFATASLSPKEVLPEKRWLQDIQQVHEGKVSNIAQVHNYDLKSISKNDLTDLLRGFDVCVHLAAQIDVRKSIENPCEDAWMNIGMTIKLLECSVNAGVKRFIYASSGGAIDDNEFPESPYGIAKLTSEKYMHFFNKHHGLETVSLRYSNVYGPGKSKGAISIFVEKMLKNEPININGGSQTRDFVFVKDVAKANLVALICEPGTYNVSTGVDFSINTTANILKAICNSESEIIYHPTIKGEVLESTLKPTFSNYWKSSTLFGEGLEQTVDYFRKK